MSDTKETETLELTAKERVFLYNQLLILEKLYPEDKDEYRKSREAIESGYAFHYYDLYQSIKESNGLSVEECEFVRDVLDMYSTIYHKWEKLKNCPLKKEDILFNGFYGNTETSYMAYCRYLINDLGEFQDIKKLNGENCDYDSHCPRMIDEYQKKLTKWNRFENRYKLTQEDILDLIKTK